MSNFCLTTNIYDGYNRITLLIIDPQNDFFTGVIRVNDAINNGKNIANFIKQNIEEIDNIIVTLDSHHVNHIAHQSFWKLDKKVSKPVEIEHYTEVSYQTEKIKNFLSLSKTFFKT